ncbi:hypothetical protein ACWGE0_28670 [Lentzea sp. NPDC054927]
MRTEPSSVVITSTTAKTVMPSITTPNSPPKYSISYPQVVRSPHIVAQGATP